MPYAIRELMGFILHRAEVTERETPLEVYALAQVVLPEKAAAQGDVVRMPPDWLPG